MSPLPVPAAPVPLPQPSRPWQRALLLALPLALVLGWGLWSELSQYRAARHDVELDAGAAAQAFASRIGARLGTQFSELQFAAVALLGADADPQHLDAKTGATLRRFLALHPGLRAVNIQSGDGTRILWSTLAGHRKPFVAAQDFTPLPSAADCLLGRSAYAAPLGTRILGMRYRMHDAQGRTVYFVGTPYDLRELLRDPTPGEAQFSYSVVDTRDGRTIGTSNGDGAPPQRAASDAVTVSIPGYPLQVRAHWAPGLVLGAYMRNAPMRWGFEAGTLALLLGAAWLMLRLLRAQDEQAQQRQRLSDFNALLAQANECIAEAKDPQQLMQDICDLAVRYAHARLACVSRPASDGAFAFPAASGPALEYLDGVRISSDPEIPEGRGAMGRAWREGIAYFNNSFGAAPMLAPWRERAERLNLHSTAVLPIRRAGRVWAVLAVYHSQKAIYDDDLRALLQELALDISRGLDQIDSQSLQDALLENSVVGIALVKDRIIQRCNSRLATLIGRRADEVVGQSARMIYASDSEYARVGAAYRTLLEQGTMRVTSVHVARNGGEPTICDFSGVLLTGTSESLSVWTIEDVTQREEQAQALARLAQFNALLAAINHLGGVAENPRALYAAVCRAAVELAAMRLAWVGRPAPVSGEFEVLGAAGAVDYLDEVRIHSRADQPGGNGPTGRAWREGEAVFVPRYLAADLQPPWDEMARRHAFGAFAALPLREQQGSAVLTVYCPANDVLDAKVQALLREIAAAVERGLQSIGQRQRIANLQRLYQALMSEGDVVLQARSEQEMLQLTCDKLVNGTMFHAAWVGRPEGQSRIAALARAGTGTSELERLNLDLGLVDQATLVARAWNTGQLVYSNDNLADPALHTWRGFLLEHRWLAALAAPVRRGGQVWGVLAFVSPEREVFDTWTIALCERVCELLGHGLDELDLKRKLHDIQVEEAHRARHDALTGLPNRYALALHLPHALARAQRHGQALAVGMLDLDDFKPVNDHYGHDAGDRLLRQLALRLQGLLRTADFLARLGGDEFVVVIEDLDAAHAQQQLAHVLERLHKAVETPFAIDAAQQAEVSMTMGVALFPFDADGADALIRHADAAMYQAKQHKLDRPNWWRLGAAGGDEPQRETTLDPYCAQASTLLGRLRTHLDPVVDQFTEAFYAELAQQPEPSAILRALAPAEMAALKQRQAEHLGFVLAPTTTRELIRTRAAHLGAVHALTGVSNAWLSQAQALYRKLLGEHLNQTLLSSRDRYQVTQVAESRLQDELQTELHASQLTLDAYLQILARPLPPPGTLWVDAMHAEIDALAALPGVVETALSRPDSRGLFQIEATAGREAGAVQAIVLDPDYAPSLDNTSPGTGALIARAWRSEATVSAASYAADPTLALWHQALGPLGVRSGMAFPVLGDNQHPVAVVRILGSYPNQFESAWMRQFATSLQQRWSTVWLRSRTPVTAVLPQSDAIAFRERLFAGGLRMVAQPVVDLHSGAVVRAEALARLVMPDGREIAPAVFLPLLGTVDLDRLFRQGLEQALTQLTQWQHDGLTIGISVNMPPSALLDPDCPRWVEDALQRHGVAPQRLTLELLESQSVEALAQDRAIAQLIGLGVRLAMDDLGSGYSSLQRLAALPFDTIKIDQGLLQHVRENPVQTLSLVRTIVQMGQDFERDVVVEGLEDDAMIEAVTILGANQGQGYALARPMPAADLPAWSCAPRPPHDRATLRHALGALAYHWQFMHDGQQAHPVAEAQCPLTRYLQAQGADAAQARQWHASVHASPEARDASRKLMDWLVARVGASAETD